MVDLKLPLPSSLQNVHTITSTQARHALAATRHWEQMTFSRSLSPTRLLQGRKTASRRLFRASSQNILPSLALSVTAKCVLAFSRAWTKIAVPSSSCSNSLCKTLLPRDRHRDIWISIADSSRPNSRNSSKLPTRSAFSNTRQSKTCRIVCKLCKHLCSSYKVNLLNAKHKSRSTEKSLQPKDKHTACLRRLIVEEATRSRPAVEESEVVHHFTGRLLLHRRLPCMASFNNATPANSPNSSN